LSFTSSQSSLNLLCHSKTLCSNNLSLIFLPWRKHTLV
jgi:hypothetical protein